MATYIHDEEHKLEYVKCKGFFILYEMKSFKYLDGKIFIRYLYANIHVRICRLWSLYMNDDEICMLFCFGVLRLRRKYCIIVARAACFLNTRFVFAK